MQSRWFHRHPGLTLLALALLGCVALIVVMEIAARKFVPHWAPAAEERVKFWAYSELLGWEHVPNQRGRFNNPAFSVDVAINSHGMRDDEYPLERTGKKRMLVIGDSFGWGFGVQHEERFSELMEVGRPDWEIINASVSGYGTDQQFLFLKEKGMGFKPDLVLLLFCENDFRNNVRREEYRYFKPFFVVENGALQLRNVPVPGANMTQRLIRVLRGRMYLAYLGPRVYGLVVDGERQETGRMEGDPPRGYEVTYHLIEAVNALCADHDSRLVLVSVPMKAESRAWLREAAARENIPYLPLDDYFESNKGPTTFPQDLHWNANGHAIAAEAIDAFLRDRGLFRDAARP